MRLGTGNMRTRLILTAATLSALIAQPVQAWPQPRVMYAPLISHQEIPPEALDIRALIGKAMTPEERAVTGILQYCGAIGPYLGKPRDEVLDLFYDGGPLITQPIEELRDLGRELETHYRILATPKPRIRVQTL